MSPHEQGSGCPNPAPAPIGWRYEIRIKGELDPTWSTWLAGLELHSSRTGETLISGPLADQAALHGLLERIRDLGVVLLSVKRLEESA